MASSCSKSSLAAGTAPNQVAISPARTHALQGRIVRYPPIAERQKVEGIVELNILVDEKGNVVEALLVTPAVILLSLFGWMGIASYDLTGDGYPDVYLTSQGANVLQTLTAGPSAPTFRDIALKRGVTATRPSPSSVHPVRRHPSSSFRGSWCRGRWPSSTTRAGRSRTRSGRWASAFARCRSRPTGSAS